MRHPQRIQRGVEACMDSIFADYSIHPSGVITARHRGRHMQVMPKRGDEGEVVAWSVTFTDRRGNVTVEAFLVSQAQKMVHKIMTWAWQRG